MAGMPRLSLAAQLIGDRDRERRDLARGLHANAAQQITALQFNLEVAANLAGQASPRAAKALADCLSLAGECAVEIRRICYALHPPLLDEIGLTGALRSRADLQKITADLPETLPRLAPEVEIGLFRIIEEALPRITRLRLTHTAKSVKLELDLRSASSMIRERVRGLRGRIATASNSLRITVPLKSRAAKS